MPWFHFYVPRMSPEDLERHTRMKGDAPADLFSEGWQMWIVQSFFLLGKAGLKVRLARELDKDSINIAHVDDLHSTALSGTFFCISVQTDRPDFLPGIPLTVVQNKKQADPELNRFWIPHWPQPGLLPRSPDRTDVKAVGYAGRFKNLGLFPHLFSESCRRLQLQPRILGPDHWHNMSEIDILVGFRSLDCQTHDHKPASKLVNAWLAGIPFIGGYDSAFAEAGRPDRDYLRVGSAQELDQALARLKEDPALYAELVANGKQRAMAYNRKTITRQWLDFLSRTATPAFAAWSKHRDSAT